MKRRYFLSDELDDLERFDRDLRDAGFTDPQMHVVSHDDAGVAMREALVATEAVLKKDVVRGTELGAIVGMLGAGLVLGVAYVSGIALTVGWVPFIFLAIIVLGFCTWEGGLFGIQEAHNEFVKFQHHLDDGRHLYVLDLHERQMDILARVLPHHPKISAAGEGNAAPGIVVEAHRKFNEAMQTLP